MKFPFVFTKEMNDTLTRGITQQELYGSVDSMAFGKLLGHDGILVEFLKCLWPTLGYDFFQMIRKSITLGAFHEGSLKECLASSRKRETWEI